MLNAILFLELHNLLEVNKLIIITIPSLVCQCGANSNSSIQHAQGSNNRCATNYIRNSNTLITEQSRSPIRKLYSIGMAIQIALKLK